MLWSAMVLGLGGGFHCLSMCGPLVLALPGRMDRRGLFNRLTYQCARLTVYAMLGLLAGSVGHSLALFGWERWVSLLAGIGIAVGFAWSRLGGGRARWIPLLVAGQRRLMPHLRPGSAAAFAVYGALNGLLPCGLVYVACAGAAATGGPFSGAAYLLVFGLGTFPLLLGLSLSRGSLPSSLRRVMGRISPISAGVLASLLILRGLALGIPYLSPDWSVAGGCPACRAESQAPLSPTSSKTMARTLPVEAPATDSVGP